MNIKINIEPETLEKHIKDFPVEPKWFTLLMNAEGISKPTDFEKGGDKRYVAECTKHNIIPYSKIELQYFPYIKMFAPSATNGIVPGFNELSENAKKSISDSIMQGGRIHSLKISADNECREAESKEAFQFLKDSLIDKMLKNSYRLDYLDICLTKGYCNKHYEEGWGSTGSLYYDKAVKVICLNALMESSIENKLKEWLHMLEEAK